ncbi:FAD-dependent oxidoreductase [Bacillus toyonensis]
MKLMTGKLFWNRGVSVPCYPTLENDMICDVLVVGSGEAGAHIAYSLAKIGMRVTLIEKEQLHVVAQLPIQVYYNFFMINR